MGGGRDINPGTGVSVPMDAYQKFGAPKSTIAGSGDIGGIKGLGTKRSVVPGGRPSTGSNPNKTTGGPPKRKKEPKGPAKRFLQETNRAGRTWEQEQMRYPALMKEMRRLIAISAITNKPDSMLLPIVRYRRSGKPQGNKENEKSQRGGLDVEAS